MKLIPEIKALAAEMTAWRRHLHAHPELSMQEHDTAVYVETLLKSFGLQAERLGENGVVATLKGTGADNGRSVLLRSDMDALPIAEETGLAYASQNPGVMHACGHDGHMAMMLGAAKYMATHNDFGGTVYFLFQPGEETAEGARAMLEAGLFDKYPADEIYGMHNAPTAPLGLLGTRAGEMMSSADGFVITFTGTGGHAANPNRANDLLYAAAKTVTTLKEGHQAFVPKGDKAVLTTAALHTASTATNVMSDKVTLMGTLRTFSSATRLALLNFIEETAKKAAKDCGGEMKIEYTCAFPPVQNAPAQTATAIAAARQVTGFLGVLPFVPRQTGSEDFAVLLEQRKGNFMALGTAPLKKTLRLAPTYALHHPKFDFNDKALPVGATYWVKVARQSLKQPKP